MRFFLAVIGCEPNDCDIRNDGWINKQTHITVLHGLLVYWFMSQKCNNWWSMWLNSQFFWLSLDTFFEVINHERSGHPSRQLLVSMASHQWRFLRHLAVAGGQMLVTRVCWDSSICAKGRYFFRLPCLCHVQPCMDCSMTLATHATLLQVLDAPYAARGNWEF